LAWKRGFLGVGSARPGAGHERLRVGSLSALAVQMSALGEPMSALGGASPSAAAG
jgi:hypothetical protein